MYSAKVFPLRLSLHTLSMRLKLISKYIYIYLTFVLDCNVSKARRSRRGTPTVVSFFVSRQRSCLNHVADRQDIDKLRNNKGVYQALNDSPALNKRRTRSRRTICIENAFSQR